MAENEYRTVTSIVLSDETEVGLSELCRLCGVSADYVVSLVEEGLVEPLETGAGGWRFPAAAIVRTRTAIRLQRDLELNLPGLAMTLQLLDEVQQLRVRVRALERLLEE